jgi:hypothetical protein
MILLEESDEFLVTWSWRVRLRACGAAQRRGKEGPRAEFSAVYYRIVARLYITFTEVSLYPNN